METVYLFSVNPSTPPTQEIGSGEEVRLQVRGAFSDVPDIQKVPKPFTPACDGHPLALAPGKLADRGFETVIETHLDQQLGRALAHLLETPPADQAGHHHVQDGEIEGAGGEPGVGFLAIGHPLGDVSFLPKDSLDQPPQARVVLGDQDVHAPILAHAHESRVRTG